MNSIMTNASAMTALQSLNQTNKNLADTQNAISTGYSVSSASDNAAYWSIATTMRSDNDALGTVKDALGLGAATVDVAQTALESTIDVVSEIKTKLVAAREPGIDREKIQDEVTELQNQLKSIADSAVFSGENWLSVDSSATDYNATKSVVSSFSRDASGAIDIGTINIDTSKTKLFDAGAGATEVGILDKEYTATSTATFTVSTLNISALTDSTADLTDLEDMISAVDTALQDTTAAASTLGAVNQRIDLQKTFVDKLSNAIERGISELVDADLNEESTRLQALQTQQQLGVQALSIANSSTQSILSLFR